MWCTRAEYERLREATDMPVGGQLAHRAGGEPEDTQMGEKVSFGNVFWIDDSKKSNSLIILIKVPVSEAVPELEAEDAGGGPRQHVRGQGARRKSGTNSNEFGI